MTKTEKIKIDKMLKITSSMDYLIKQIVKESNDEQVEAYYNDLNRLSEYLCRKWVDLYGADEMNKILKRHF